MIASDSVANMAVRQSLTRQIESRSQDRMSSSVVGGYIMRIRMGSLEPGGADILSSLNLH